MSIIVSIVRFVRGVEVLEHFRFGAARPMSPGYRCMGCPAFGAEVIAPVGLLDSGEVDPDADSGMYLCEPCSMRLPKLSEAIRAEWPSNVTALEVERVWRNVRDQLAATLDDLQRAVAAVAAQDVNNIGKVA